MKLNTWFWCVLALSLGATDLAAQATIPPTDMEIHIWRATDDPTSPTPFRTLVVPFAGGAIVCNLLPTPTPTAVINPRSFELDDWDVTHVGKACQVNIGSFIQSLPIATGYRATGRYFSATGPTPRSNVTVPFDVAVLVLGPPTRLGVRP